MCSWSVSLPIFTDATYGVVFSTGYIANLGMLSSLTAPGDVLLIDADSHASIYDGCRLSGAEIIRFRHNDPGDLEKRLKPARGPCRKHPDCC